ncbi:dual specificity protein kinase shkD-like [Rhagoletis pomonella]|uniref:dual specificity protein kinase shkD-like n=1 Tax=Rhagoletis pomonella TaxID=28610 RepID=UPI00177AFEFD|nr:dual specificity protein kinase shkD-like [Rhagoletis pomonella]
MVPCNKDQQRTLRRMLEGRVLQGDNVVSGVAEVEVEVEADVTSSACRQQLRNKNRTKSNYNHINNTHVVSKQATQAEKSTGLHSTDQEVVDAEQQNCQQQARQPQQQQQCRQQSQLLITLLDGNLQQTPATHTTASAKSPLPSVGGQLRYAAAKSMTSKVGAKNVLMKWTCATKKTKASAAATTTTTAVSPTTTTTSAPKTKRSTIKSLKSAFECPSTRPPHVATTMPANYVTPTTTATSTTTPMSCTPAIPTASTAASWATVSLQLFATVEQFCCRATSKSTANSNNNNNNSATSTTLASSFVWLLPVLCLLAAFGCGQAGFACLSNPCVFGVCIDGLNSSSYSCYCIDGYTGIQCQTNWDECWSGPCQNGGTCIDGVAYYNCTCPDGFTGKWNGNARCVYMRVVATTSATTFSVWLAFAGTMQHTETSESRKLYSM